MPPPSSAADRSGTTIDGNDRWEGFLTKCLRQAGSGDVVVNGGNGGTRAITMRWGPVLSGAFRRIPRFPTIPAVPTLLTRDACGEPAVIRLKRDVVNLLNVSATILFGGVNDIGAGATAAFADDQVYPDLVRRRVNECLRASKPFDAVFDSGAVVRDPAYLSRIRPDLEAPGHIHLNLEGYEAVAAIIPLPALASAKPKSRAFRRGRRRSMGA